MNPVSNTMLVSIPSGKPDVKGFKPYQGQKGDGNCLIYSLLISNSFNKPDSWKSIKEHRRSITRLDDGVWIRRATVLNALKRLAANSGELIMEKAHILQSVEAYVMQFYKLEKEQKCRIGTTAVAAIFFLQFEKSPIQDVIKFSESLKEEERTIPYERLFQKERIDPSNRFLELNSLFGKYHILHTVFQDYLAHVFNMEWSSWSPLDPINVLSQLIKEKGALVVPASLGVGHSEILPNKSKNQTIEEYELWDWNEGYEAIRKAPGHVIVVMGVNENEVCFIDPHEPSNLDAKRRVFSVPYSLFCNKVINSLGVLIQGNSIKNRTLNYIMVKNMKSHGK